MKIIVNKCPYTGVLFESDSEYKTHLAGLARDRKVARKAAHLRKTFADWLEAEKAKILSIDMIAPWILENQQTLMDAYNASGKRWDKFYEGDKIVELVIQARYSGSVSNTHSCPHNGTTNWGGMKAGAPRGYPGFTGSVEGVCKRTSNRNTSMPTSDMLGFIRLNTGTGGGGFKDWRYGCEIFLADWPGLAEGMTFNKLKGVS